MSEETAANMPPAGNAESTESSDPWSQPLPPEDGDTPTADVKVETDTETTEGEAAKLEEKPKEPKSALTEAELRAAALKFANSTMAAARRAERATASVKAENDRLKSTAQAAAQELEAFKAEFKKNPFGAVKKLGYAGIKEFVDAGIEAGEPKADTADDRVTRLEQQLAAERAERNAREQATNHETAKGRVQAALSALPDKYDATVNTNIGRAAVWEGITEYARLHGTVPDAAVYRIANNVEQELATDIGRARRFKSASPASTGTPSPATASGARTGGSKTITNTSTGGAHSTKDYSLDWEEGRKQILADMKAAGEI